MRYDDHWFLSRLSDNTISVAAEKAFRYVHGSDKKPEITLSVLEKNLNKDVIKRNRETLNKLDHVVDPQYADLVKYCAVTYANFCDEVYAGLDDFYFQSINTEWLLHSESGFSPPKGRYRDHLTHQLKVTLLGIDFLKGRGTVPALMENIVTALKKSPALGTFLTTEKIIEDTITEDLVMAAWLLAGMFHDVGYCFVMNMKTSLKLASVSDFFEHDLSKTLWKKVEGSIPDHSYILEFYRRYGEGVDSTSSPDKVRELIEKSAFAGKNHSVIGALYLLYMLQDVQSNAKEAFEDKDLQRRMRLVFELAALAILTHDLDSPDKQGNYLNTERYFRDDFAIPFKDFPLSYLLGLCDQLQDWGRRRVVRIPSNDATCLEKSIIDCEAIDFDIQGKRLVVRFVTPLKTPHEPIDPSWSFFGESKKLGEIKTKGADLKSLVSDFKKGRLYILNFVYGACPAWETCSLIVEAGGTSFSSADYYGEVAAKQIIG